MAIADTGRKGEVNGDAATARTIAINSTVAGNFIAVMVITDGGTPTVSDDVNGAYTNAFTFNSGSSGLWYKTNIAGGNITITITPNPTSGTWSYSAAHEFSGVVTSSPLSGTPDTNNTGSITSPSGVATAGPMTPADNDVLMLACCRYNNFLTSWTINAGGEGFSNSNDSGATVTNQMPGALAFKIISGAPGTPSHSWTITTSNSSNWAAAIAAFKPSAGPAAYTQESYRFFADDGVGLGEAA
jgi:hypothetical protein